MEAAILASVHPNKLVRSLLDLCLLAARDLQDSKLCLGMNQAIALSY